MKNKIILEPGNLREMIPGDLDDLYPILSDPIAMRYYPKPFDRKMTKEWIERNINRYRKYGFGLWAVIHTDDNLLIGDCGLTYQLVAGVDELEIGYHILRSYWKQGLATQCAIACRDYAFDELCRDRVISWMNPENAASRTVAEKIGMRQEKETTDSKGRPAVVYSMTPKNR